MLYMAESKNNLKYSADLLDNIIHAKVEGVELSHLLVNGKYNAWNMHQEYLIFHTASGFGRYGDYKQWKSQAISKKKALVPLKNFVLFIVSITLSFWAAVRLLLRGDKVVIFSGDIISSEKQDHDRRLNPIYDFLKTHGVHFTEIFYTLFGRRFIKNVFYRKRAGLYLQAIDALFIFLHPFCLKRIREKKIDFSQCANLNESEEKFARGLIVHFLYNIKIWEFRIAILTRLLKISRVRVVLSIDDATHYNDLIVACKEAGVLVYSLQHGHFTKYDAGFLEPKHAYIGDIVSPDKLFVWSDYWKDELIRLGTFFRPDQIIVGGIKESVTGMGKRVDDGNINVLLPYETIALKKEVFEYVTSLLDCGNVHIYFKLRPDKSMDYQLNDYGFPADFHERFHVVFNTKEIIDKIDIVAGTYSTFLYDMVEKLKPVAMFKTDLGFGDGMILNGLADPIDTENICSQFQKMKDMPEEVLKKRRDLLCGGDAHKFSDILYGEFKRIGILVN